MRILSINAEELIQSQIQFYFKKKEESAFIHRLHTILLKLENKNHTSASLGKILGHSNKTISTWINKLNENSDLEALRTKPKTGRKPKLNKIQLSEIKEVLQKDPEESGVVANIWDGKSLSFYIEQKYAIILGVRQCQRLFKTLGFSLKRARPVVSKGDPAKKEAFKKNVKKN